MILEEREVVGLLERLSMPTGTRVYQREDWRTDAPELVFATGNVVTRSRLLWMDHEAEWDAVVSSFVLRTAQTHFFSVAHERGGYS